MIKNSFRGAGEPTGLPPKAPHVIIHPYFSQKGALAMKEFEANNQELLRLLDLWVPRLLSLTEDELTHNPNDQGRTAKQIIGHMVDSASNNTHRIIWLSLEKSRCPSPTTHRTETTTAGSPRKTNGTRTPNR